jgi:long-chain acyl-CoA synthetase
VHLSSSPGAFIGVLQERPAATAETRDAGGLGPYRRRRRRRPTSGHLKIIDRAKDVGRLTRRRAVRAAIHREQAEVLPLHQGGGGSSARTASSRRRCFISIDLERGGQLGRERNGLSYTSYTHLASLNEVYGLIRECIQQVNRTLSQDSALTGSQIRRFLLLHKELDADDGELTRTRKVRRRIIADRYKPLIDAMYAGADHVAVEGKVTFEDGRTGVLKADLMIQDAAAAELPRVTSKAA